MANLSQADLKSLLSSGFIQADPKAYLKAPPRLALACRGKTKHGKSHFAYMTTPQPVASIMLDPGSHHIANKAAAANRIIIPKFINHSKKESKEVAEKLWQEYRSAIRAVMATKSIRTLVVDTITEAWELLQMATFGKINQNNKFAYGPLNAEFAGLVDEIYYARPDLNIIYIQKIKKEYGADEKWDGKSYYAQGFSGFDYLVDVNIIHGFNKGEFFFETDSTAASRLGGQFSGLRFGKNEHGISECSFLDLALHIYGPEGINHPQGSDPSYWEG